MNLARSLAVGAQDDPADLDARMGRDEPEDGAAAADLDVVSVAADREDAEG